MELKSFIGKVVISAKTNKRYVLCEITSPSISVKAAEPDVNGYYACYSWSTINGDPISTGTLAFEDKSLTETFKKVYEAHCRSKDGYWEDYGYWMRRD